MFHPGSVAAFCFFLAGAVEALALALPLPFSSSVGGIFAGRPLFFFSSGALASGGDWSEALPFLARAEDFLAGVATEGETPAAFLRASRAFFSRDGGGVVVAGPPPSPPPAWRTGDAAAGFSSNKAFILAMRERERGSASGFGLGFGGSALFSGAAFRKTRGGDGKNKKVKSMIHFFLAYSQTSLLFISLSLFPLCSPIEIISLSLPPCAQRTKQKSKYIMRDELF